ncbi:PREDICTED: death-associated inhibitor of apoptosis 1-like [Camelina sativa]|uniref:Death-associated inhibitor of apoptosis 1-like n=1 Tax=Camelina sativa TaxID=90675 RepID=A0ABM0Y666_CAMSA|nr:PREDICTED: death-associated inhibitor of apoptosis 1-like [Camelina sativa]
MSQQLSVETSQSQPETPQSTTFLDLLRLQMDGLDRTRRRKRTLKERLGFKRIGCCGPTWGLRLTTSTTNTREDDEPFDNRLVSGSNHGPVQLNQGMNLAAALAAERNYRTEETVASSSGSLTPLRVSLMRLLEETAERVVVEGNETASSSSKVRGGGGGNDSMCCVCMGRKKGAALIPCGHTFCRVCSREVWLNRGSCPLCNRPIIEILDIY